MPREDVEGDFPALKDRDYDLSDADFNFNCLAYAMGDKKNWWEPPNGAGNFWPAGFPDDLKVRTVTAILTLHGFTVDIDPANDPKTEAIAIYAPGDEWTHFAKFGDGVWSSKLGEGHDVVRIQLKDLEGKLYGQVAKILSRPDLEELMAAS